MVNIPHSDLEFYREAMDETIAFIQELSASISLMKELEETTEGEMDVLLIQEITWDLRQAIGDQHELAKYYRETANKLERIYRGGQGYHQPRNGPPPERGRAEFCECEVKNPSP